MQKGFQTYSNSILRNKGPQPPIIWSIRPYQKQQKRILKQKLQMSLYFAPTLLGAPAPKGLVRVFIDLEVSSYETWMNFHTEL